MATLIPTISLSSTDALSDPTSFSATGNLSVLGDVKRISYVMAATSQDILANTYNKSYVFICNKSTTANEKITVGKKSTDATCDYNNSTTITMS